MRKEYVFLFVLFGVAAMITGFTVGFVANYQYIEQGLMERNAQQEAAPTHSEEKKAEQASEPKLKAEASTEKASSSLSADAGVVVQPQVDGTVVDVPISANDLNSINSMLDELNVASAGSESDRIRNFQQQCGIQVTGELDSYTLNAIIQQVAAKHAQRNLYGG